MNLDRKIHMAGNELSEMMLLLSDKYDLCDGIIAELLISQAGKYLSYINSNDIGSNGF